MQPVVAVEYRQIVNLPAEVRRVVEVEGVARDTLLVQTDDRYEVDGRPVARSSLTVLGMCLRTDDQGVSGVRKEMGSHPSLPRATAEASALGENDSHVELWNHSWPLGWIRSSASTPHTNEA